MDAKRDTQEQSSGQKSTFTYEAMNLEEETAFHIRGVCSKGSSIVFSLATLTGDVEVREIRLEPLLPVPVETMS